MHLKVYHVLFQMQNKMKWFHFPMELPSLLTLQGLAYNNQSTQNYFPQKPRSRLVLTILLRSCFPAFKRANLDRNLISFFCWGQFDGYSMEREASHMHHICRVTVSTTSSYPSLFSPGWASSLAIPLKCTLAIQRPLTASVQMFEVKEITSAELVGYVEGSPMAAIHYIRSILTMFPKRFSKTNFWE